MRHQPQVRRFVNRLSPQHVALGLMTDCDELQMMEVVLRDGSRRPLQGIGHDYYRAIVPAIEPFEYVFYLHACGSHRWLTPAGLHANSCEPAAWFRYEPQQHLAFTTPAWVRDAVFYQIFPDRFANGDPTNDPTGTEPWGSEPRLRNFMGGDIAGILGKLDYLQHLGISALYLTPIFKSASNHKYDTIDYFTVDEHFGDLALVKQLVAECHRRGMHLIFDAVFNHCSNIHPFFLDVRKKGPQSKYWDWFHVKKWPIPDHFSKQPDALEYYECWWGFHTLPQLNYRNPEVEQYFLKVATYWLEETGMDGWRLDVPNEVIQSFWPKFRHAVKTANPNAYIVGEIWDDATPWLQGDQFDAVMNYRFQKALIACFAEKKMPVSEFNRVLRHLRLDYPEQATAVMLNLLGSHDTVRLATAANNDVAALQQMATVQFSFEGAPCIYYGDEIGLEGGKDPDCRRCYPWHRPEQQNQQLFEFYRRLIQIRRENPALRHGTFRPVMVDDGREFFAFERRTPDNRLVVAVNRHHVDVTLEFGDHVNARDLLSDRTVSAHSVVIPARQCAIWRVE